MDFTASLAGALVLVRAVVTSLWRDGVMVVYSSNLLIGDECGLISSRLSMSVGYSTVKESPLNENNGNWSVDGQPSLRDGNIGEWSTVTSFSVLVGNGAMLMTLYVTMQHFLIALQVQEAHGENYSTSVESLQWELFYKQRKFWVWINAL